MKDHAEDIGTIEYLRDTAIQAGLETARIAIEDIGWDGQALPRPRQPADRRAVQALSLGMAGRRGVRPASSQRRRTVIEPAWKMVLSNKAALALLWEMAPNHPNLLPASWSRAASTGKIVRKPIYSREGANIQVLDSGRVVAETDGGYGAEGFVYQAHVEMPSFDGNYPVIGSWVIASQPAGIGIREDYNADHPRHQPLRSRISSNRIAGLARRRKRTHPS